MEKTRRMEQEKTVARMYRDGAPTEEIREKLHIGNSRLFRIVRESGVPMRNGEGRDGPSPRQAKHETKQFGRQRFKRLKAKKQTTTNIVMLQRSYGADFAGLANRVLAGELLFRV